MEKKPTLLDPYAWLAFIGRLALIASLFVTFPHAIAAFDAAFYADVAAHGGFAHLAFLALMGVGFVMMPFSFLQGIGEMQSAWRDDGEQGPITRALNQLSPKTLEKLFFFGYSIVVFVWANGWGDYALESVGLPFLVLIPLYIIAWFAIEIRKSWRGWRGQAAAKRQAIVARDERRHVIGCDL
jgi:hypothetical protein